jgi:DNA-binding response OmpR family regulator
MKRHILLVDDDRAVLETLKAVLELHQFEVDTASTTTEAFSRMEAARYDLVLSDLKIETEDAGLEVIRAARRQKYSPATALLTAYPPAENHWDGENNAFLLMKPLRTADLLRQIDELLRRHEKGMTGHER